MRHLSESEAVRTSYLVSEDGTALLHRCWPAPAHKGAHGGARGHRAAPTAFIGHTQPTHSGSFADLGRALAAKGWTVRAGDLRGHGRSTGAQQPLGHLDARTGWDALVADMRRHLAESFAAAKPVPWESRVLVMPNISALLTLELLKEDPGLARHIVLVSPPPNQPAITAMGRAFIKARGLLGRLDAPDPQTLHHLYSFLGAHLPKEQPPATRHLADVMSRDRAVVAAVLDDPLAWPTPTLGYWSAIFEGYARAWRWPKGAAVRPGTRVLLLTGEDDPMMGSGALTPPMLAWLRRCGIDDLRSPRRAGRALGGAARRGEAARVGPHRRLGRGGGLERSGAGTEHQGRPARLPPARRRSSTIRRPTRTRPLRRGSRPSHAAPSPASAPAPARRRCGPEELVELCYSGIDDEERWVEILYRLVDALSQGAGRARSRTRT